MIITVSGCLKAYLHMLVRAYLASMMCKSPILFAFFASISALELVISP